MTSRYKNRVSSVIVRLIVEEVKSQTELNQRNGLSRTQPNIVTLYSIDPDIRLLTNPVKSQQHQNYLNLRNKRNKGKRHD